MRKLILILIVLLAAGALFAAGEEEGIELIVVDSGTYAWEQSPGTFATGGYDSPQELVIADYLDAHPNVTVTYLHRDVTQGSMTVDALMAKGTPPDVWIDAGGYFRDYLNADYSLPLEQYIDISVFQPDLLAPYTVDGHVYAIPAVNVATGMAINTTMLEKIGYTIPPLEDWTTEEFVRLAKQLRAVGEYATSIFTQEGFTTWLYPWLYAFGAELFADGDYSRVAINTPEAREGLEYIKMLVAEGYAPPYPNEIDDDITVELFTTGKIFSAMMQNGHTDYWIPEQVNQGALDEVFGYTFIEFPHAPGRDHTPVSGYQTVVNVHRSDDEARNQAAAALAAEWLTPRWQGYATTLTGGFTVLKKFELLGVGNSAKPSYQAIAALAPDAGFMDLGGMHPRAAEVIAAAMIPIQEFMAGEISAQQFLDTFEAEANRILTE